MIHNVVMLRGDVPDVRIEERAGGLVLPESANGTGASLREWMPAAGASFSARFTLASRASRLVLCLHRGEEYGRGLYDDCVELVISGDAVIARTPREELGRWERAESLSGELRLSRDGGAAVLSIDGQMCRVAAPTIPGPAKLVLLAEGSGAAELRDIARRGFTSPRVHLARVPGGEHPRPEHPRPDMRREGPWQNLNGLAEIAFDPHRDGEQSRWFEPGIWPSERAQPILLPFPWQAPFSLVHEPLYAGDAWQRLRFRLSPDVARSPRLALHFGAVDYECRVWLNGALVGKSEHGMLPITIDISREVLREGENEIILQVIDRPEDKARLVGKQGTWYTHVSGVWQTVWIEGTPIEHLEPPVVRCSWGPAVLDVCGRVEGWMGAGATLEWDLRDGGQVIASDIIKLEGEHYHARREVRARPWTPDAPVLHDLRVKIRRGKAVVDEVATRVGFRTIEAKDGEFLLNGAPVYLHGVLDQAFHPDGLYTYSSDECIRADVQAAKDAGFNLIRLHIKVDEPRFLHWADTLGMLVWAEPPSFVDAGYHEPTAPGESPVDWPEGSAKRRILDVLQGMVMRDAHHASIIIWGIINEGWGVGGWSGPEISKLNDDEEKQAWLAAMMRLARQLDPTRPWVDNSTCPNNCYHVDTDVLDNHDYADHVAGGARSPQGQFAPWRARMESYNDAATWRELHAPARRAALREDALLAKPRMNSEYGAWPGRPWFSRDIGFPLQYLTNEIRRQPTLKGYIYTELQDIAWELNGVLTYDRRLKDLGLDPALSVNAPFYVGIDGPMLRVGSVSEEVIPFFRDDRHTRGEQERIEVLHRVLELRPDGQEHEIASGPLLLPGLQPGVPIDLAPFSVSFGEDGAVRRCELEARIDGQIVARNWAWLVPENPPASIASLAEVVLEGGAEILWDSDGDVRLLRIPPGGRVTCRIVGELPGDALLLEAASDAALHGQTMPEPSPARLLVSVDDATESAHELARGLSDARGILSYAHDSPFPGAYGELLRVALPASAREASITLSVPADSAHGVLVFGARNGRHASAPGFTS